MKVHQCTALYIFAFIVSPLFSLFPHNSLSSPLLAIVALNKLFGDMDKEKVIIILLSYFFTDFLLYLVFGFPFYGSWLLFTLSAYLLSLWLSHFMVFSTNLNGLSKNLGLFFASVISYWLWTNFGVWLMANLYPKTFEGFLACYIAAIPFLKTSLFSSLFWGSIVISSLCLFRLGQNVIHKYSGFFSNFKEIKNAHW